MNVSLTPQLELMIRERVESGRYNNASEVVQQALRLLEVEEQKLDRLRGLVKIGVAQIERGEGLEDTDEFWDELDRDVDTRPARNEPVTLDEWP
jgi:antitoxin ParD1/3/4